MERKRYVAVFTIGVFIMVFGIGLLLVSLINGGVTPTTPEQITQQSANKWLYIAGLGSSLLIIAVGVLLMAIAAIGNDINQYVYLTVQKAKPKTEPTNIYKT